MAAPGDLIAVTGGSGALGRRVVRDLLDAGYRLRLLSREAPAPMGGRVEHAPFDLLDEAPVAAESLAGCAAVAHLAAHIPRDEEDPSVAVKCFQANAVGTVRLLQAMEEADVVRILHTTAANAYAPQLDCPTESAPMYPFGRAPFYLTSKLAQDIFVAHWASRCGIEATTLRVSALYGAGQYQGLFTRFARALLGGETIRLANGGSYAADFVTIADVSAAISMFLEQRLTGPFNIASGERNSVLEVARLMVEIAGCEEAQLFVEPEQRPEPSFPRIDISKARHCGFTPTGLPKGLLQLVEWIRS